MTCEVSGVPHSDIHRIMPLIDKYLNNVIPYTGGRYEKQDIIEGIESKIIVSPVIGETREGKDTQRGHIFNIKFKLPIPPR